MAFTPVEVTNGTTTAIARTRSMLVQYLWDGWWVVGTVPPGPPQFEAYISRTGTASGQVPILQPDGTLLFGAPTVAIPDATPTKKGASKLAGDLGGTADAPTVTSGANHGHAVGQLSDASTVGKSVLTAADGAAARAAIGAGTSNLQLGGTADTAASGTHGHTASAISDLVEAVQDIVGSFIVAGTGCTVSYDDAAGTFTINVTGGGGTGSVDPEGVRDTIGAALVAGSGIQITVDDPGDTITISSTAVLPTRKVLSGTGLSGGGDLSADRTLSVIYGTTAGTAAQGNDSRITGAVQTGDARVTADQAAGTASIRTLGTGAQQAAAGNHGHTATGITDSTSIGRSVLTAADAAAARTVLQVPLAGIQIWTGAAWSARPAGIPAGFVTAYSDGSHGSTRDANATAPTGGLDGDAWEYVTA